MYCALCAHELQSFVPLTRQPSFVLRARVRTLAKSEPESGSLIPIAK
jgi:hypothetical protein